MFDLDMPCVVVAGTPKLCGNCKKERDTKRFCPSLMDEIESEPSNLFYEFWCKPCILETQLRFAKEIASNIACLEIELDKELSKYK